MGKLKKIIKRYWLIIVLLGLGLIFFTKELFAAQLDEQGIQELKTEILDLEQSDPKLADALKKELIDAIAKGEITLLKQGENLENKDAQMGGDITVGEQVKDVILEELDLTTPDGQKIALDKLAQEKDNLLKEGFTEDELKLMEEKIKAGEAPSEIFERHALEHDPENYENIERVDYPRTLEEMEKMFVEIMGREPSAEEREMMEKAEASMERNQEYTADHEFSLAEMEKEFVNTMGRGPTEQEIEQMKEVAERMKEGNTDHDFSLEGMEREFVNTMGREPNEQEVEQMKEVAERMATEHEVVVRETEAPVVEREAAVAEREWTREDMEREMQRMDREPTEQERQMMEQYLADH